MTLPQNASLSIVKTASPTTYADVDDVISYSYLVTNTGHVTLTNAPVTDESCTSRDLPPGASLTCTVSHTVT